MNRFEHPVTPAEISIGLRGLIDQLIPGGAPVYVEVQPSVGALVNECFQLVEQRVKLEGGQSVFGWSLWELPTVFVEAEFHSVWQQSSGELLDVAPKNRAIARVFFLPDPARMYEEKQVNNIRKALRPDPLLLAYLATFDAEFDLLNRGERAFQHEVALSGREAEELDGVRQQRAKCFSGLLSTFPLVGPYHPCLCGSGKKVKWCHKQFGAS
jgi:hypothetical protein